MTWKQFKKLLRDNGVKDSDEIDYIDVDSVLHTPARIEVYRRKEGPSDDDGKLPTIFSVH